MMPILVKSDDVRSGRKAKARHGRHGSQWVNLYYSILCIFKKLSVLLYRKRDKI